LPPLASAKIRIRRILEKFVSTSLTAGVNRGMETIGDWRSPIPTRAFGVRDVAS
jgi:hypothetical protein